MKGRVPDAGKELPRLEVPEDVAVLYAWADLQGARYRDFSASRREARAKLRQRAAQSQSEAEMLAKVKAEESATESERAAQAAEESARFHEAQARKAAGEQKSEEQEQEQAAREQALQSASDLNRRAAKEREEAVRRTEALRAAEDLTRREAREIAEAHASAQRQAQRYAGTEARDSGGLLTELPIRLGLLEDPYTPRPHAPSARMLTGSQVPEEDMRPERFPQRRAPRTMAPINLPSVGISQRKVEAPAAEEPTSHSEGDRPGSLNSVPPPIPRTQDTAGNAAERLPEVAAKPFVERRSEPRPVRIPEPDERTEAAVPAWIHGRDTPAAPVRRQAPVASPAGETLQHSRERVASRWYALRGVFDPATPEMEPMQARARETASPVLAVFSFAGGVGKTSLTASLGRSLSAVGEKVLLTDLTPQGILPFYFGATELRPGVVRTFSPPPGSADTPVSMLSYDLFSQPEKESGGEEKLLKEFARNKEMYEHVLVDLSPAAASVLKGLAQQDAMMLVPIAPDMNTVISLGSMERFFAGIKNSSGRALQPVYLLTQFEASLPLHLDVREGLRQKLGHRLLPFVIRRSTEVSEALAEGMTVIDYAPESGVAADYRNLANWLRSLTAPAHTEARSARWSEQ